MEKDCFILYFYSDKLGHYKTYFFRKFLNTDAFKYVRLQNTLKRCKVYQILSPTVDYACFLVKCINYHNEMFLQISYLLQDLARFLQETSDLFIFSKKGLLCRSDVSLQDSFRKLAKLFSTCKIHCKTGACRITCNGCRYPVPQVTLPADAGKDLRR